MIVMQGKLPRKVSVACSGGVDSMAVVDFLKRNHNVTLLFFHHGTETSEKAYQFLKSYSSANGVELISERIKDTSVPKDQSQEEYWRNCRYKFFLNRDEPVVTCHHLDDCVETWVWSSLNGNGKIIPYNNRNVIRPFRVNKKSEFVSWAKRNDVPWVEDESNKDTKYTRNFIRHEMMPKVLTVNPGIHKTIARKVRKDYGKLCSKTSC